MTIALQIAFDASHFLSLGLGEDATAGIVAMDHGVLECGEMPYIYIQVEDTPEGEFAKKALPESVNTNGVDVAVIVKTYQPQMDMS